MVNLIVCGPVSVVIQASSTGYALPGAMSRSILSSQAVSAANADMMNNDSFFM
jgi:hypothetical protein